MNKKNGCLIAVIGLIAACLIALLVGWFVILPRAQDATADQFHDATQEEVAEQVQAQNAGGPGHYTISETDLSQRMADVVNGRSGSTVNDVQVDVLPDGFDLSVTIDNLEVGYTGSLAVEEGELVVVDPKARGSGVSLFVPADDLASAIEDGFNEAIAAQGLQVASVTTTETAIEFDLEPAAATPAP